MSCIIARLLRSRHHELQGEEDSRNMRPYIYLFAAALAFLIGLFDMQPVRAQGLYGSLVGNITDPSDASIPGARVKITHVETNLVRETLTNTDGTYTFPTIPPGTYQVEIAREGFQTVTRRDIPVTINTTVRVDASMQVGAASQSVEVTGPGGATADRPCRCPLRVHHQFSHQPASSARPQL